MNLIILLLKVFFVFLSFSNFIFITFDFFFSLQGFLNKRGNKGFQFFKRRYFVLREDDLYYCYDNSMASMLNPLGKIDVKKISQVQLMLDIASLFGPPQHHLYLHTPTRIYILSTDVKKDAIKWSNW